MKIVTKQSSPGLLLIDGEHAFHRAYHAHAELMTSNGIPSGGFYGLLSIVKTQVNRIGPKEWCLAWGGKNAASYRRSIYPKYKDNRDKSRSSSFIQQLQEIKRFFALCGAKQYRADGYEGDDVIATIVHQRPDDSIVILSGDHDFHQLVTERITCLQPGTSKRPDVVYTIEKVVEKWGVTPGLCADFFSLTGDEGDNIPGVPGIGEVTAAEILNTNGPIKEWISNIQGIQATAKQKALLTQHRQTLFISKKLISLKNTNIPLLEFTIDPDRDAAQGVLNFFEIKKFTVDDFLTSPK
jgi:5'-3' exonuclease